MTSLDTVKGQELLQCAWQGEYNLRETEEWLRISLARERSQIESQRIASKNDCGTIGAGFCQFDACGA
jgi:hypothetical protein